MGTTDVMPFDNDAAADWAAALLKVNDLSLIEDAIAAAEVNLDAINAPIGEVAIAAADVLARLRGGTLYKDGSTRSVDDWVQQHPIDPPDPLLVRACTVLEKILGPGSELNDLWDDDADDGSRWAKSIRNLHRRLGGTGRITRKAPKRPSAEAGARFAKGTVVAIAAFTRPMPQYNSWNVNDRPPRLGDHGHITEVIHDGRKLWYLVEAATTDPGTYWLTEFDEAELQPLNGD